MDFPIRQHKKAPLLQTELFIIGLNFVSYLSNLELDQPSA